MAENVKFEKQWWLQISGKEHGPLDYYQVVSKIVIGEVTGSDFIRHKSKKEWQKLSQNEEFFTGTVSEPITEFTDVSSHIWSEKRAYPRFSIIADAFVKKDGVLLKGRVIEVGRGGMGIESEEEFAELDSIISLYCSPVSEFIAFNCHAKITSKIKINKNRCRYGLQFLKVSEQGGVFLEKILDALQEFGETKTEKEKKAA